MVHSVELLLDPEAEAAIRRIWKSLADMGLRSPAPTSRPHITLVVANRIEAQAEHLLARLGARLPFGCLVGAPLLFGSGSLTLVRMIVPSAELVAVQAEAYRVCVPHATPAPMPNCVPGRWSPHVTLARRVDPAQLGRTLGNRAVIRDVEGRAMGLRRWDGNRRVEHLVATGG